MQGSYLRNGLLVSSSFLSILAAQPAMAQASNSDPSVDANVIVVTARRIEEDIQDVPISITVYNSEQIANNNIMIATDLATYTPSLSINQRYGPEKASFSIRGFNQDLSTAPTVGVYFADVVGVRAQGGTTSGNTVGAGSFTDLQNVQILKGPQGTLFGRNTTGGAVLLVPQKPTDAFEGSIEGTIGNFDQRRLQAVLNVPLADTFKVRLAVDRSKRDGYMRNHAEVGPKAYNDVDYTYGRLSVVADLTPNLENYMIATYSRSDTYGYAGKVGLCDRNPFDPSDPTGIKNPSHASYNALRPVFAKAACDQMDRQDARGDGVYDVEVGARDPHVKIEQWQIINTTTWQASDYVTIKNTMSYGQFRERSAFSLNSDNLFVPNAMSIPGISNHLGNPQVDNLLYYRTGQHFDVVILDTMPGYNAAAGSTFTEELQIQGQSANGRLNYVVGGYLEFSRPLGWNQQRTGVYGNCIDAGTLDCKTPLGSDLAMPPAQMQTPYGYGVISQSRTKFDFDNHGIFAQATYKISDQLAITAGGRYTFDTINGVSESTQLLLMDIPMVGVVNARHWCNDTIAHPTVNISAMSGDGSGDLSKCSVNKKVKSKRPTWLINLDYKPTPDMMFYAKYSRGYRQGGLNFTTVGLETWGPEKVDAYELGAKVSIRGPVRGYFNMAAFYNDFSGQQIFGGLIPLPSSNLSGASGIVNAGSSTIKGVEVDTAVTLFDSLNLSLGYTYLDTKIKSLTVPNLSGTLYAYFESYSKEGGSLAYSPKHRLTLSATYRLPVAESVGRISVGGTYVYTSSQVANEESPVGILPSSNLVNLNLNWDSIGGTGFDAGIFVTNVTKEKYPIGVTGGYSSYGFEAIQYGAPRMYGLRLKYNFGG